MPAAGPAPSLDLPTDVAPGLPMDVMLDSDGAGQALGSLEPGDGGDDFRFRSIRSERVAIRFRPEGDGDRSGRLSLFEEIDLRLTSPLSDVSGIPTEGRNLIVVAAVGESLHFRIFDGDGAMVVDADEASLPEQARQIEYLRGQLEGLRPPHDLAEDEEGPVIAAVASIVGYSAFEGDRFVEREEADDLLRFDAEKDRTYLVKVDSPAPAEIAEDALAYRVAISTDDYGEDLKRPSDFPHDATIQGVIDIKDDRDVFRFVANNSGTAAITLTARGGGGLDGSLAAFDTDAGEVLAMNDDDGPRTRDSKLQFNVKAGQTYFVEVEAASAGSTGPYTLGLAYAAGETGDEFGNTLPEASPLALNADGSIVQEGAIQVVSDRDVFQFAATQSGVLRIRLVRGGEEDSDLRAALLEVLTPDGKVVGMGDVIAASEDLDAFGPRSPTAETVDAVVEMGREYDLRIQNLDGGTGAYTLVLQTIDQSPPPPPPPDVTPPPLHTETTSSTPPTLIALPDVSSGGNVNPRITVNSTLTAGVSLTGGQGLAPGREGPGEALIPFGRLQANAGDDPLDGRQARAGDGLRDQRPPAALLNSALKEGGGRGPAGPEIHPQDFYDGMLPPSLASRPGLVAGGAPPRGEGRAPTIDDRQDVPFLEGRPGRVEPPVPPIVAPQGDERADARGGRAGAARQSGPLHASLCIIGLCGLRRCRTRLGRWIARHAVDQPPKTDAGPRV